jgi:hypothetical protein
MRRLVPILLAPCILNGCDLSFVGPVKISSITVEPAEVTVAENQSVALTAVVRDALGNIVDEQPEWRSDNYYVVSPMEAGRFVGNALGTTYVSAALRGKVGRAKVTVVPGVVGRITAYPDRTAIATGQKFLINVEAFDETGGYLPGRPATYTSTDPSIITVAAGQVTGVTPGIASIIVAVEGKLDTVFVKVVASTATFNFYKRGGSITPGVATLTYSSSLYQGTLAIDGRLIPVQVYGDYYTDQTCMTSPYPANQSPDAISACAYNVEPLTMRLCTGPAQQLQYVLMPAVDSGRVVATAEALLSAIPTSTAPPIGIGVYNSCTIGSPPSRWIRSTATGDYNLWPSPTTYSAAAMTSMLDSAALFSRPAPGNLSSLYVAIRVAPTVFELWH